MNELNTIIYNHSDGKTYIDSYTVRKILLQEKGLLEIFIWNLIRGTIRIRHVRVTNIDSQLYDQSDLNAFIQAVRNQR